MLNYSGEANAHLGPHRVCFGRRAVSRALPVGIMMRHDAKAMVAYSGLAELKAALDPRQRFVDEITPVGRSMAETSRGDTLLSSAGRAAPLTGGFTAGPRALAKSCGRVAAIGKIARAFRVMDRVFTGKLAADNGTSRASGRSSICSSSVASRR